MKELFLVCVLLINNIYGVVVSYNILDKNLQREWVIVETYNGTQTAWIDEIQTIACSKIEFDKIKNRDYIEYLLDRREYYEPRNP